MACRIHEAEKHESVSEYSIKIQYVTIYPACLGPEGCQTEFFWNLVARPKMYKNTRK
jgi:hypothetical protein